MATQWRLGLGRLWSSVASRGSVPHRPTFTNSLFAALLAIGVVLGFVAVRAADQSARTALPPTTVPPPVHPTTTPPPTTPPQAPATAPPTTVAATAAPLGPCGPQDLQVTVSVSGGGGVTDVETVLHDLAPCSWQPVAMSGRPCPDTIAVESASGAQVWPAPGQGEQCSTPAGRDLSPGQVETLSAAWDDRVPSGGGTAAAPAGGYTAVGTWSWATSGGQPAEASGSESFSLG